MNILIIMLMYVTGVILGVLSGLNWHYHIYDKAIVAGAGSTVCLMFAGWMWGRADQ